MIWTLTYSKYKEEIDMFNNNGIILKNRGLTSGFSGTTRFLRYYVNANVITYSDGTNNSGAIYAATSSSDISVASGLQYMRQLNITGAANTSEYINYEPSGGGYLSLRLGYRASPFTENTYTYADSYFPTGGISISLTSGLPTLTCVNNTASSITVNEITISMVLYDTMGTSDPKKVIIGAFSFPDITIAPSESYTFTIMYKNS